ncbi:hypothetical protein FRB99_006058 [Tulasnella sp. 403]|nr:hypothetical protein FRB99_006058 [Tulasnella sp. 403]
MMPTSSSSDWSGFSNVYEVHSPQVILSNSTRNVLLDYYYSSSNRRGFEYHMSHRAIAFIQEQLQSGTKRRRSISRPKEPAQGAAARAATALRRILTSESSTEDDDAAQARSDSLESLPRIVQQKRHFCVLLKPQIALHCEEGHDSVVYIAAMEATLQSYMVVDLDHIDDSVNGYIMRRQYVQLHGVQAFVPTVLKADSDRCGVPLEVLVDFRCESQDYERLVPQTDASIQYDRFNRLRLHSQAGGSSSDLSESESSSTNEHMKIASRSTYPDSPSQRTQKASVPYSV